MHPKYPSRYNELSTDLPSACHLEDFEGTGPALGQKPTCLLLFRDAEPQATGQGLLCALVGVGLKGLRPHNTIPGRNEPSGVARVFSLSIVFSETCVSCC